MGKTLSRAELGSSQSGLDQQRTEMNREHRVSSWHPQGPPRVARRPSCGSLHSQPLGFCIPFTTPLCRGCLHFKDILQGTTIFNPKKQNNNNNAKNNNSSKTRIQCFLCARHGSGNSMHIHPVHSHKEKLFLSPEHSWSSGEVAS